MPRYVVLYHECPDDAPRPSHWDFMLEVDGVLHTWALEQYPESDEPIEAVRLADHRLAYLDYEGPISGGRGILARFDQGSYRIIEQSNDKVHVKLVGERLSGDISLTRHEGESQGWRFMWSRN